jgi:hypothetical protein
MPCHPDLKVDSPLIVRVEKLGEIENKLSEIAFIVRWWSNVEDAITFDVKTALYCAHWFSPPFNTEFDRIWMLYFVAKSGNKMPRLIHDQVFERLEDMQIARFPAYHVKALSVDKYEVLSACRLGGVEWKAGRWLAESIYRRVFCLSYMLHIAYTSPSREGQIVRGGAWGLSLSSSSGGPHFGFFYARNRLRQYAENLRVYGGGHSVEIDEYVNAKYGGLVSDKELGDVVRFSGAKWSL